MEFRILGPVEVLSEGRAVDLGGQIDPLRRVEGRLARPAALGCDHPPGKRDLASQFVPRAAACEGRPL
jgi:hypothetical protein